VADPHIWHSAVNNGAIVAVIAENLAQVNPEQAERYADNAAQLSDLFAEIDAWIQQQVATIPAENRKLVTTHDAFRYFAAAYGVEVKGALGGLSTAERPAPKTLTDLVDQIEEAQVPAIFAESTTNPELINAIAKDANVKVAEQPLFVEGPGAADSVAPTTQSMLTVNTCTMVNALGGTCAAAEAPE
jgi:manganese/iron transport system substrate-binding protein